MLVVEHLVVLEVVEQRAGRALGVGGEEHRGALDAFGRAARKRGGKLRHRDRVATLEHMDDAASAHRSEERRVGKECVSTCRSRWSPYNSTKKNVRAKEVQADMYITSY